MIHFLFTVLDNPNVINEAEQQYLARKNATKGSSTRRSRTRKTGTEVASEDAVSVALDGKHVVPQLLRPISQTIQKKKRQETKSTRDAKLAQDNALIERAEKGKKTLNFDNSSQKTAEGFVEADGDDDTTSVPVTNRLSLWSNCSCPVCVILQKYGKYLKELLSY